MNKILNYILYLVLICASTSCIYEDTPEELNDSQDGAAYFSLNLSTRAQFIEEDGGIKNLIIWVAQKSDQKVVFSKGYKVGTDIFFYKDKNPNGYKCIINEKILKTAISQYGDFVVYAVINKTFEAYDKNDQTNTKITLSKKYDPQLLQDIYFPKTITSKISKSGATDETGIPMYGVGNLTITEQNNSQAMAAWASVSAKRALSKLEVFFAKKKNDLKFEITNIQLNHKPKKGYLVENKANTIGADNIAQTTENISTAATDIPNANVAANFDESSKLKFLPVTLTDPYLLENPFGNGKGTAEIPSTQASTNNNGYQMLVTYNLGSKTGITTTIDFPSISRNELFKIYILADQKEDGKIDINVTVSDWQSHDLNTNYE